MRWQKRLRRRITYPIIGAAMHALVLLAACLPDWLSHGVARAAAWMVWIWPGESQRLLRVNLAIAYPEKSESDRDAIAKGCLYHLVRNYIEFLQVAHNPKRVATRVDLSDLDGHEILALKDNPNGRLMVMPHLGSWELLGLITGHIGAKGSAVSQTQLNPWIDRLLATTRSATGMQMIDSKGAVRGVMRALKQGRHVGLLIDQATRPAKGGVFVDFFGLPAAASRIVATMARRMKAEIVVLTCIRVGARYHVRAKRLDPPGHEYPDDESLTQAVIAANEELIREYPDQYVWLYKRWRHIPAAAPQEVKDRYPYYAKVIDDY